MNPNMGGGMGGGMLRSMRHSDQIGDRRVSRGTTRRILAFARPYRFDITVFLVTVVAAAGIGVATPVLAGDVINALAPVRPGAADTVVALAEAQINDLLDLIEPV